MRLFIGPDSLKGSVSAQTFCQIALETVKHYYPEDQVTAIPLADGGEGTVEALVSEERGKKIILEVTGPLGDKTKAAYGIIQEGTTGVIEMASASGLILVPESERNPMITTTYGTGELIMDALKRGCTKIIVGIGGSATNDGGLGMMQALGYQCLDEEGESIQWGGTGLRQLATIKPPIDPFMSEVLKKIAVKEIEIEVACDVDNPLYGDQGAAVIYGPQKGADPAMVMKLDEGLRNFANVAWNCLGIDLQAVKGAGAAGGLGAGLLLSLSGELKPGFQIIAELLDLKAYFDRGVDWVITSEGQMNDQSLKGKLPIELAKLANHYDVPTLVITGRRDLDIDRVANMGIRGIIPIADGPISLETSMKDGQRLIRETIKNVIRLIHL